MRNETTKYYNRNANYYDEQEGDFTLKEKIQYGLLGVVLLGGSFFIGRNLIRQSKANNEENKTFEENSPATYAKQLKMAFENDNYFGWGTDEAAIRNVLSAVQSKNEFKSVMNSYDKLYNRSLLRDMKDELTATEYKEMLAIIASKPNSNNGKTLPPSSTQYQAWAKRLKAAFEDSNWIFPGTDEDAVKAVFMELPTQRSLVEVGNAYKILYRADLMSELKDELTLGEFAAMLQILKEKPKG
jgi:hypothetical protein